MITLSLERLPNFCNPLFTKEQANRAGMGAISSLTFLSDRIIILAPSSTAAEAWSNTDCKASSSPLCPFCIEYKIGIETTL